MATLVTVTALKAFTYDGRRYVTGDPVDMVPVDALVAARIGQVSLTKRINTHPTSRTQGRALEPEQVEAEDFTIPVHTTDELTIGSPEIVPTKRRYRRRDLTPEP